MAWQDYVHDMQRCTRCSYCKWIPYRHMVNTDFIEGCPSVARYKWHAYAASGKFNIAYSLLQERIEISDPFLEVLYKCHMDGSCDISCKVQQDIEPLQLMQELRIKCVEEGELIPEHMMVIEGLRKEDNMMQARKADRGNWAAGTNAKILTGERAEVVYHAGCRYSFDEELWPVARAGLSLLADGRRRCGHYGGRRGLLRGPRVRDRVRGRAHEVRRASDRGLPDGPREDARHPVLQTATRALRSSTTRSAGSPT